MSCSAALLYLNHSTTCQMSTNQRHPHEPVNQCQQQLVNVNLPTSTTRHQSIRTAMLTNHLSTNQYQPVSLCLLPSSSSQPCSRWVSTAVCLCRLLLLCFYCCLLLSVVLFLLLSAFVGCFVSTAVCFCRLFLLLSAFVGCFVSTAVCFCRLFCFHCCLLLSVVLFLLLSAFVSCFVSTAVCFCRLFCFYCCLLL